MSEKAVKAMISDRVLDILLDGAGGAGMSERLVELVGRAIREAPIRATISGAKVIDPDVPLSDGDLLRARAALAALEAEGMVVVPVAVLQPFANFADPRRKLMASVPITAGSPMAKRQLTMGDCYRAADAIAARSRT